MPDILRFLARRFWSHVLGIDLEACVREGIRAAHPPLRPRPRIVTVAQMRRWWNSAPPQGPAPKGIQCSDERVK